jgi:hypothetical protein
MQRVARILSVLALLCAVAGTASANIYLDEDFEGATAFTDRDWPVKGYPGTAPTPATVAVKGANLHSYDADAARTLPKPTFANTGTITSARHFLGAKSLQLATGQSVALSPVNYVNKAIGEIRFLQFAVSTDAASAALAPGTIIGEFKSDWSTIDTTTINATLTIQFRVNAAHRIEAYCTNTSSVVATFDGGVGSWLVLSRMANIRYVNPPTLWESPWEAYDPLTTTYKGPVTGTEPTTFPLVLSGMRIYGNSKTAYTQLLPDQVGTGWGSDNASNPPTLETTEIGWSISALNGGTLFVDDIYWDGGYHAVSTNGWEQEQAARMKEFDQASSEPPPPQSAAKDWHILQ